MTRDSRTDPQPGDELRGGAIMRRMLKREGGKLLIQSEHRRYWMRVDRWRVLREMGDQSSVRVLLFDGAGQSVGIQGGIT
jgi:hypothetical protein